jgi:hypothetical protein
MGLGRVYVIGTSVSEADQVLENTQESPDRRVTKRLDEFPLHLFSYAATQKVPTGIIMFWKVEVSAISRYIGLILCQVAGGCVMLGMGDAP